MKRQILISALILLSIQTLASAADLYVPSRDYPTIQSAINDAVNGDVVIVAPIAPDVYTGLGNINLDFGGKAITVRSEINPDNPNPTVIAATIIDCGGQPAGPMAGDTGAANRAFWFHNGEGPDSKVLGFTIINGYARGPKGADGVPGYDGNPVNLFRPIPRGDDPTENPPYALDGADANGDAHGGAILCEGASSPTIQYCAISDCTVTGAHGGRGADGLWGTWYHWTLADVDPCTGLIDDVNNDPTENTDGQWGGRGGSGNGNGYGGAIACLGGSSPIISDCTISDNFARGGRGGDGGDGGNAEGDPPDYGEGDESFGGDANDSIGDGIGGGIYAENGSNPIITNCTFSNNIATTGTRAVGGQAGQGNGIPVDEGGPATDGAVGWVYSLTGGIAGGAAYHSHPSDANFTNCTFTDNKAYEAYVFFDPILEMLGIEDIWRYTVGGALYSDTSNIVNLSTCDFTGNLGGAIYCDTGCNLNFDDCLFMENSETADGGALYISTGCTVELQNCVFGGNSAYDDGGALKCRSNATLTNCSFGGNRADSDDDDYGYGGAIDAYEHGTTLVVDFNDCGFTGNQAIYGGGFSSENFDANFIDCYFIGNTAQEGGGLDLVNGDIFVTGGAVKGNDATDGDGGGFNCRYTKAEIRNCTIMNNSSGGVYPAGGNGGAINFYGGASTRVVFNCLIIGNSATVDGGAILCHHASPEIGNCIFSDNLAGNYGGAIFSDWASDPQITDSIFENCSNHAIHEEDFGGDALVKYSLFFNNPGGDYYDSGTGITYSGAGQVGSIPGGSNNLYGNPLFVSGDLGDYYLSQIAAGQGSNSPAIDNGSDTAVNLGLDTYTTRTDNAGDAGQVDRGYHYPDSAAVGVFQLTASVIGGHGTVEPTSGTYYAGAIVTLTAKPNTGWRVKAWSGTDDDSSTATTNSVIMNSNRTVTVEFEQPKTLIVAVGGGEEGYYSNIQDAVQYSRDGDTIVVYPGTYYGGYEGLSVYVDKSITIRSTYPDDPCCVAATIIDGYMGYQFNEGYNNLGVSFGPLANANTILNGFTIQNCGGGWGDGLNGNRQQGHPNGEDGGAGFGAAIRVYPGGGPVIKNCVIRDNAVVGGDGGNGVGATGPPDNFNAGRGGWGGFAWGGAVYCGINTSPTFINCQFIDNYAQGGNGGDGGNQVVPGGYENYGGNWSMRGTLEYPALDYDPFSSAINTVVDGNLWEIWEWDLAANYYLLLGLGDGVSYIGDYRWYSGYGGGVFCDIESNVTFTNCKISGNQAQGGVSGQGGLNSAGRPTEPLIPYEIPSFGGGVYCAAGSTITFTNCTITENISSEPNENNSHIDPYLGHGGGICAEDTATLIFTDCTFSENEASAGGGLHFGDANPVISDCNFTSNMAFHGGGLYGEHGPATILRCNITDNNAVADVNDPNTLGQGGGLHFWATEVDIIDCNISSNQADASGGGVFFGGEGTPSLFNCLVTNNTAGRDGGGVSSNIFTSLTISNCTIADNTVTGVGFPNAFGGGLYVSYESDVNVIDSIIWGNVAINGPQIAVGTGFEFDQAPSNITVSYSDIGPRAGLIDFEIDEPPWDDWDQNDGASLIDAQTIYDQFGVDGWAEVIVSLFEPVELRETTDWTSPESVAVLREEIDERQDSVLSTLAPAEFTLRHRFENQTGFSGDVTSIGLSKLLSNSLVAYIEPVRYIHPMLAQGIPLINATTARLTYNGEGMAIAICDTGVDYTHPRLGNGGFPNDKVIGGYDFGDGDANPIPNGDAAHGTACAGIAAGDLGTVGDYIGGVAYNAKIYALKISYGSSNSATTDAMIAAWDWCVTHKNDDPDNPIMVTSTSFGGGQYFSPEEADSASPAMTAAANNANAVGITVLASSGNEYYTDSLAWPAAISSVISVGAVDDVQDTVMDYSNTADFLDILAPADWAYTLDIAGSAGYDAGDYYPYFNGTSAACPYAAGTVAGLQSAAMAEWGHYLNAEQVRTVLVASGVPITDTKVDITKPRVNLAAAISYLTAPPIYVEDGCTFIGWDPNAVDTNDWDPNFTGYANISENPLFVDGYLLSQTEAGQEEDSNCVDAGSDLAINLGLDTYTTRTDQIFDKGFVDMGYHYPLALAETCRISDLVLDGVIDSKDFAIFAQHWLEEDCSADNNWCAGADLTFDTRVDTDDLLVLAGCWLVEDTSPPLPNPSEWEIEPYSTSTTPPYPISMTAKTAVDAWGFDVEYYFECVTDGDFNSPDWQSSSTYEPNGFTKNVEYGFKVRARDTRPVIPDDGTGEQGNKTGWSVIRYAIAGEEPPPPEDNNPPIPDPMTWATPPYATSPTSIAMVATTAVDDTAGVQYYFEDFDLPAVNSGWIDVPTWEDTTCVPETTYTYRVMARDTSANLNETGWSDPCSATTPAEPPPEDTNPPEPVEWEIEPYETGGGLNAYANMTAAEAIDPEGNGVQYYFECVSIPSINSGWMDEREWNSVSIGRSGQFLYFHFKVRDLSPNLNESGWSTSLPCY